MSPGAKLPTSAPRGRPDPACRRGDGSARRLLQGVDERFARCASADLAAPQPQIAVRPQRPADRSQILGVLGETQGRPRARGKTHVTWRAVRDDVDGGKIVAPFQRRRHLPRRRPLLIQHDRRDAAAQIAEDGREIGDGRIDEQHFASVDPAWDRGYEGRVGGPSASARRLRIVIEVVARRRL
jgi:hypothetical protein